MTLLLSTLRTLRHRGRDGDAGEPQGVQGAHVRRAQGCRGTVCDSEAAAPQGPQGFRPDPLHPHTPARAADTDKCTHCRMGAPDLTRNCVKVDSSGWPTYSMGV